MPSYSDYIDGLACQLEDIFAQPRQRKQIIDDLLFALQNAEPDDWDHERRARFRQLIFRLNLLQHHTNTYPT
jgi:hypothetical protein